MKLSTNIAFQIIAVIIQVLNYALPTIPDKYKPVVLAVVGIGQAIVAGVAHNYNTDGTPQAVAFKGDTK